MISSHCRYDRFGTSPSLSKNFISNNFISNNIIETSSKYNIIQKLILKLFIGRCGRIRTLVDGFGDRFPTIGRRTYKNLTINTVGPCTLRIRTLVKLSITHQMLDTLPVQYYNLSLRRDSNPRYWFCRPLPYQLGHGDLSILWDPLELNQFLWIFSPAYAPAIRESLVYFCCQNGRTRTGDPLNPDQEF